MKRVIIVVVVLGLLAGAWFAFNRYRAQRNASAMSDLQVVPAELGNLTASVGATGTVRANQSAVLGWQTTGIIAQVAVTSREQVSAGDVLASLKQSSLPQNIILAQAELVNARRDLDNLLDSTVQQAQALKAVEQAEQALEDLQNPELMQAQAAEAVVAAQKAVEDAERRLRIVQSTADQADIDAAEAQVVLAEDALDKARQAYEPYAGKPETNLVRANLQARLAAAQQSYDAVVSRLNSLMSTGSETDVAIAQASLVKAQAEFAAAQREWERVKAGPSQADIALAQANLQDARRGWERLKDGPDPDDVASAEARIAAAQATLDLAQITAPFSGVLTAVRVKPGDQASPGLTAFRLDDLARLMLDVQISEVDINRVQVGQSANLTFDAIPGKEYHGVVSEVAPTGNSSQGVVEFTVTVELTNSDEAVRPGMTAAVNVVVDQLENVLLVPNRAVRVKEGQRVVYVLRDGELVPVEITLGASSEVNSQVLESDLQVGDQIVLNPPQVFEQSGPPFMGGG